MDIKVVAKVQVDAKLIVASRSEAGTAVSGTKRLAEEDVKNYLRNLPFNDILQRTTLINARPGGHRPLSYEAQARQHKHSCYLCAFLRACEDS